MSVSQGLTYPPGFASGAWASRPAAATGGYYFATDLGNYGCLLHSNGTYWTPAAGSCVLYQPGASTATTSAATETNLAAVTIPAGLLTSKGRIDIEGVAVATGTTNTKIPTARISSVSGDISGGSLIVNLTLASANISGGFLRHIWAAGSTSAQTSEAATFYSTGGANTAAATAAIDTTAAWYVNFNGKTTSASDTIGFQGITVRWVE